MQKPTNHKIMGFFSWKSEGRSISNVHSIRGAYTVYMVAPDGRRWREDAYEGYGEFGGKDFYELLAELNGEESNRDIGIELQFRSPDDRKVIYPRFTTDPDKKWEDLKDPKNCPHQGYFYSS